MDARDTSTEHVVARPADLGTAIGAQRRRLALSRGELAEWVGSNGTYIGRIERGEAVKRMSTLFDTLDALGLELVVRPKGHRE